MSTPQLQISNATFLGRSHHEFSIAAKFLPKDRPLKILSFGCSTGEEVRTLRTSFPDADITGCDIHPEALAKAELTNGKFGRFVFSDRETIERYGPYDLIACMSVFCQWPPLKTPDGRKGIAHDDWSATLALLADMVRPGGCLLIVNSNFPFRFHDAYGQFAPIRDPRLNSSGFVDQFTPSGALAAAGIMPIQEGSPIGLYPWHYAGPAGDELDPWDFHDQLFIKTGGSPGGADPVYPEADAWPEGDDTTVEGEMSYIPPASSLTAIRFAQVTDRATFVKIRVRYRATLTSIVHIERVVSRIGFDGQVAHEQLARYSLKGLDARLIVKSFVGTTDFVERR